MREFTKGTPDLIAKAKAESIRFVGMDGDGCQAPGAIVIRKVREASDLYPNGEYAVHFANTQCGGYHGGEYTESYAEAVEYAAQRVTRYDPDGSRRLSFQRREG